MLIIRAENGNYCEFKETGVLVMHAPQHKARATRFDKYENAEWALNNLKRIPGGLGDAFKYFTICVFNTGAPIAQKPKLTVVK